jgi:heme/copper-type cytochrome/quinol oxidase subunit 2
MRRTLAVLAVIALVGGCAHTEAPAVSDCSSTAPGAVLVTSEVRDGQASPAPHRVLVPVGSTVQVRVAADKVVEVHIHGYDLEYDAAPGTPGCVSFVADRPGLFDVEAHPDTALLQLEVR